MKKQLSPQLIHFTGGSSDYFAETGNRRYMLIVDDEQSPAGQKLRAIHAQACAAVARADRTLSPVEDRFWPLYLTAALALSPAPAWRTVGEDNSQAYCDGRNAYGDGSVNHYPLESREFAEFEQGRSDASDEAADNYATALAAPEARDEHAMLAVKATDLDFTPDDQHSVCDMANIGKELLERIASLYPDYAWNDSPTEIVSDLINERDEARQDLAQWAVSRWNAEVSNRPIINVHRRPLDDTWRQVIRHCGADAEALLGPKHDDLVAATAAPTDASIHTIPPMTDPLGRHWKQPERDAIAVDGTHAAMSRYSFDQLPEYSRSRPSGVYPGKMWKSITRDGTPYLCWYGIVEGRDDLCSNNRRLILICG